LAERLLAAGAGPDRIVAVFMERSLELVVALLGILKAGSAYLPLGTNEPDQRLHRMLEDARPIAIVVQPHLAHRLRDSSDIVAQITLPEGWGEHDLGGSQNAFIAVNPDNLAYVIYTSGSTGQPKGVAITHRGLSNYVFWCLSEYDLSSGGGTALHTSLSFDLTVTSIFPSLASGNCIWIGARGADIQACLDILSSADQLSLLKVTPSHLLLMHSELLRSPELISKILGAVNLLVVGGEALNPDHVAFWRSISPSTRIINEYGPTEAAVGCCVYEVGADLPSHVIPIGRGITNARMYTLDRQMKLCSIGIDGELYIAGDGLARGYLGQPGLTAERFLPNPYSPKPGDRIYRTGDLGRWREDGQLEYLGRIDQQVKILGHRVELPDIEAALLTHPDVGSAAVLATKNHNSIEQILVAYVALRGEKNPGSIAFRMYLRQLLPEYMLPAGFVMLNTLPLTEHGKIDRGALAQLPVPRIEREDISYEGPRSPVEEILTNIWADILSCPTVSIHDNFFALGGHSLLASRAAWRIAEIFPADISLKLMLQHPTISSLAQAMDGLMHGSGTELSPIVAVSRSTDLPLSYAQQRLWFLDQLQPENDAYNVPIAMSIHGPLKQDVLLNCLNTIIARHEILRTTFSSIDGVPVQKIRSEMAIRPRIVSASGQSSEAFAAATVATECKTPFDLQEGPLLRVTVIPIDDNEHVLIVVLHHIICDGWSMAVLSNEFAELYTAEIEARTPILPNLNIQYADYAVWQREWLGAGELDRQLGYWRKRLASPPSPVNLGTQGSASYRAYPESEVGVSLTLSQDLIDSLRRLSHDESVTLNMTLITGLVTMLNYYCGGTDILVGIDIAGRRHVETENLIGFFVNQLVLRADVQPAESFRTLLRQVRKTTLEAYSHQDVPFDQIVAALGGETRDGRQTLFNVKFTTSQAITRSGVLQRSFEVGPLQIEYLPTRSLTPKLDLLFNVALEEKRAIIYAEFDPEILSRPAVELMIHLWSRSLSVASGSPEIAIGEIANILGDERESFVKQSRDRIKQSWDEGRLARHGVNLTAPSTY
jgi:amino acid adenylation domain-containing protein